MPAHLRPLRRCDWFSCDRAATESLHNNRNAMLGHYCGQHAKRALKDWVKKHPDEAPRR